MAPNITIKYFDMRGRAEPLRLACAVGDIPFKDERVSFEEFGKMKERKELPFDQLPVMVVDGQTISQSGSIERYLGKLTGLYPKDDLLKAAKIDEMIGATEDVANSIFKYRGKDEEKRKEARKEFVEKDAPRFIEGFNRICGKDDSKKYLCGDDMSIADLALYFFTCCIKEGVFDHVPKDLFDSSPKILRSYKAVNEHPKVVEWNKAHPPKQKK